MKLAKPRYVVAVLVLGSLAACGGGDDGATLDLGGGLSMTADGAIIDRTRAPAKADAEPDFLFASAQEWQRYAAQNAGAAKP